MRALLDAHDSDRYLGEPLRALGHDVRALHAEPERSGLPDRGVLALATEDRRVLVTRNGRHFGPIAREWASRGRVHAGLILVWTLRTDAHAALTEAIDRALAAQPDQETWRGLVLAV